MTTVPLPLICLTCLPPWPQAMMYAGKNLENRDASVAARLAPFVGQNVGISQSKTWKSDALVESFAWMNGRELLRDEDVFDQMQWALFNTDETAGKLLLVAHLVRVAKPSEYGRNPWHVAGQHGLVLSNVRQIEPVPCRGAVGAWKPYWCASCGAISAAGKSMQCAHCRAGNAYREDGERPALRECQRVAKLKTSRRSAPNARRSRVSTLWRRWTISTRRPTSPCASHCRRAFRTCVRTNTTPKHAATRRATVTHFEV